MIGNSVSCAPARSFFVVLHHVVDWPSRVAPARDELIPSRCSASSPHSQASSPRTLCDVEHHIKLPKQWSGSRRHPTQCSSAASALPTACRLDERAGKTCVEVRPATCVSTIDNRKVFCPGQSWSGRSCLVDFRCVYLWPCAYASLRRQLRFQRRALCHGRAEAGKHALQCGGAIARGPGALRQRCHFEDGEVACAILSAAFS